MQVNPLTDLTTDYYLKHILSVEYLYFMLGYCLYGISSKGCIQDGEIIFLHLFVSNGVKQGDIICSVLFNVYLDDLSCALNRSNIGGRIGCEIVNHLSYAADLCLISVSSEGMQ